MAKSNIWKSLFSLRFQMAKRTSWWGGVEISIRHTGRRRKSRDHIFNQKHEAESELEGKQHLKLSEHAPRNVLSLASLNLPQPLQRLKTIRRKWVQMTGHIREILYSNNYSCHSTACGKRQEEVNLSFSSTNVSEKCLTTR